MKKHTDSISFDEILEHKLLDLKNPPKNEKFWFVHKLVNLTQNGGFCYFLVLTKIKSQNGEGYLNSKNSIIISI